MRGNYCSDILIYYRVSANYGRLEELYGSQFDAETREVVKLYVLGEEYPSAPVGIYRGIFCEIYIIYR